MKANKAPEKLYLHPTAKGNVGASWLIFPLTNEDIEYTRTDSFIEKALKWYCLDCECNDNCKDFKCFFHNEFKRHLEGNEHAIPPKFETAILNPDGSTTENWRYRHFIRKMQDDFIDKAADYIKKDMLDNLAFQGRLNRIEIIDGIIEKFIKAMKGE